MRIWFLFLPAFILGSCSSLPHDGPSGRAFKAEKQQKPDQRGYALVDLDYRMAQQIAAGPAPSLSSLAGAGSMAPNDQIGDRDVIAVTVVETGGTSLVTAAG